MPSLLIVENASTDGEWIKLVAEKLRPGLAQVFYGPRAMVAVTQAGGVGEIPKELRRLAQPYIKTRPNGQVPLRILALADSDAPEPGRISNDAKEVRKAAEAIGASSHILKKRTIENYVPDESLVAYAQVRRDTSVAVAQITTLSGPSRDHYPMKHGVTADDLAALGIYPKDLGTGLGMGDFIHDLIVNFRHSVTSDGLRERDGSGELEHLLDELERNL